jgi:hypothetical protein
MRTFVDTLTQNGHINRTEWKRNRGLLKCQAEGYNTESNGARDLTDRYIINTLYSQGVPREVAKQHPELIEAKRLNMKIKRIIWNK